MRRCLPSRIVLDKAQGLMELEPGEKLIPPVALKRRRKCVSKDDFTL